MGSGGALWVEVLRILSIVMGASIIGMSATVFYVYALKVKEKHRAVLPWHVVLISFSYAMWTSSSCIDMGLRLWNDSAVSFRLPMTLLAGVSGIVALIVVLASLERAEGQSGSPENKGVEGDVR